MTERSGTTVDPWGRVVLGEDGWFDLLWSGGRIDDHYVEDTPGAAAYNALCRKWQQDMIAQVPAPLPHSPEDEHRRRAMTWHIPPTMLEIPVREFILSLCDTEAESDRCAIELNMFEERGLFPVLQTMIYLVDDFRSRNVVWGVGRGSSVSSFVLFKIGVHKINSLKYSLPIDEFLK